MRFLILNIATALFMISCACPIPEKQNDIKFYSRKDPYGEFSNFSPHPFVKNGISWPTSEHYYQAHKFSDPVMIEKIRAAQSPEDAAHVGRSNETHVRSDWENYRDEVMREAILLKFTQHENLKRLLLSTGNKTIIEHTKNDCYWADCGDGSGKNRLGILLMELRNSIMGQK